MPRLPTIALGLRGLRLASRPYSSFKPGPAPPKLPAAEQAEFDRLQRKAAVSSAFQTSSSPDGAESATDATTVSPNAEEDVQSGLLFRGAPPEFKGDTNPKTGEVGGPKNEPLRWGGQGDWSYNGKVTDF